MTAGWQLDAERALGELIAAGDPFTADDLIARCGHPDPGHSPNARNNGVGTLFREAAKAGRIVDTGRHVRSTTPSRKGGMIRVWVGA
jgi:hypothetical protein